MTLNQIIESPGFKQAPQNGWMLAYTRSEVIFKKYDIAELPDLLGDCEVLEMHLFDDNLEYRCVQSESKRFMENKGMIDCVVPGSDESDFVDECVIEDKGVLSVINKLGYDENGMVFVENYRLMMKEG